ncbi:MAG TPA: acyl carrier protein [Candidatus Methanoperedens sp.]|nr:acyl carrier protein [Candidatus Methanoperedens sp.]
MHDSATITEELKTLVAEIIEVDRSRLTLETHFVRDLDMDSLMSLELLTALEKKYAIRIPEEALPEFATLSGVVEVVSARMLARSEG